MFKWIKVFPTPTAEFSTDKEYGLPPLGVQFANESTSSTSVSYNWDFDDHNYSTAISPYHIYLDSAVYYPQLIATNTYGCSDSISHTVYAVYKSIDVAISQAYAEIEDGFISYSCIITNLGKQQIKELVLKARYNAGVELSENWRGNLRSGESINYFFKSKIKTLAKEQPKYFCISAEVLLDSSQQDEYLNNNTLCEEFTTKFSVSKLYPNPTAGQINYDLLSPSAEAVNVLILDIKGIIIKNYTFQVQKGLNQISFDAQLYPTGQYMLMLESKENREIRKFLKY